MTTPAPEHPELLVTQGGHLYRALRRAGCDTPARVATTKAAVVFAAVAWLPLLVLSLAEVPRLGPVAVPFLEDFSTALRFLVALPLLVFADSVVAPRLAGVARHFIAGDLVPPEERGRFDEIVEQVLWLRDALLPQLVILALALGLSVVGFTNAVTMESTWHAVLTPSGLQRTWAGWVYDFVTLPLYRVVMLTWVWRYVTWTWFLWRTSRLKLRTVPSHPDLSGGLLFVGVGQEAFGIVVVALSIAAAGLVGMQAARAGTPLASFYPLIGGYLAMMLIVFVGPLFLFSPALFDAKRRGLQGYAALGGEYTTAFEQKWIHARAGDGESLLGSADIQSLADLAGSFDVVRQMRPYPFDRRVVAVLGFATVGPLLPLALVEQPVSELLVAIVQLLL